MAVYCIDDGGDGTQTNTTHTATTLDWSKAHTTIANLLAYDAAAFTTSGNVIYFGHDTTQTQASALTITGPTSGLPVIMMSATRGTTTPTYQQSTTNQIQTTGANAITLDGAFAIYGIRFKSGANLTFTGSSAKRIYAKDLTVAVGANGEFRVITGAAAKIDINGLTLDLTADGTSNRTGIPIRNTTNGAFSISGLTVVNAGYRTANIIYTGASTASGSISGADFSGFTNATLCEITDRSNIGGPLRFTNCKTAVTWSPFTGTPIVACDVIFTNCGPTDAPTYLALASVSGDVVSSSSIYRSGGAQIGGASVGWLVATTAACGEGAVLYTPWIHGNLSTTGSKTFDLYITNDTADLTDAECWLEVEYLGTSGSGQWSLASDQRTITTTAAAQTDDASSTWNGSGPSFTYKQKLSVTATVNQTGQFRARVAVGKASIASSAYFYIDPRVNVS